MKICGLVNYLIVISGASQNLIWCQWFTFSIILYVKYYGTWVTSMMGETYNITGSTCDTT